MAIFRCAAVSPLVVMQSLYHYKHCRFSVRDESNKVVRNYWNDFMVKRALPMGAGLRVSNVEERL